MNDSSYYFTYELHSLIQKLHLNLFQILVKGGVLSDMALKENLEIICIHELSDCVYVFWPHFQHTGTRRLDSVTVELH